MTKRARKTIESRLKALEDIDNVEVYIKGKIIHVSHRRDSVMYFKFEWLQDDRLTGYFLDKYGNKSQAIIAIDSDEDAKNFETAYRILTDLRARRSKK